MDGGFLGRTGKLEQKGLRKFLEKLSQLYFSLGLTPFKGRKNRTKEHSLGAYIDSLLAFWDSTEGIFWPEMPGFPQEDKQIGVPGAIHCLGRNSRKAYFGENGKEALKFNREFRVSGRA